MQDAQVERLILEVVKSRESFDESTKAFREAIDQIRWNRINTIIQYILIFLVMIMGSSGVVYYVNEKHAACGRGNELRIELELPLREC